jgi:hypothetical protein
MAEQHSSPLPFRLTILELESLVDRLRARAVSHMFPDMPILKTDLALAAAAIKTFIRKMAPGDVLEIINGG